jgi:hypothetical protein
MSSESEIPSRSFTDPLDPLAAARQRATYAGIAKEQVNKKSGFKLEFKSDKTFYEQFITILIMCFVIMLIASVSIYAMIPKEIDVPTVCDQYFYPKNAITFISIGATGTVLSYFYLQYLMYSRKKREAKAEEEKNKLS